eukprot:Unigene4564_Nuclearia_a/m.13934 Unigene4564_Nuclearia_a/g.13934  ORF Unigene4564_Nuclearia_a/g.13934 Unigene4564_Nuclearia_a/m.13934 type:complete len:612 (+) Unigene4564_Nuclearia_a:70-1905(+)
MATTGSGSGKAAGGAAHKVQDVNLLTPTTCAYCDKFIWGMYKQASHCTECLRYYHKECLTKAGEDCAPPPAAGDGHSRRTSGIGRALGTIGRAASKREVMPDTAPHLFDVHTYSHPTWCQICNKFVWGLSKQGYRCTRCGIDAHWDCLAASKSHSCLSLSGGTLQALALPLAMVDPAIARKVNDRRTNSKSNRAAFKRDEQYRLNAAKHSVYMHNLARASLIIMPMGDSKLKMDSIVPMDDEDEEEAAAMLEDGSSNGTVSTTLTASSNETADAQGLSAVTPHVAGMKIDVASKRRPSQAATAPASDSAEASPQSENAAWQQEVAVLEDFVPQQGEYTLDDFEITDKELGRGQFGIVKVAKNKRNGQQLAVKIIDKKRFWGRKPESTRHLKREISILSQLRHPQVIRLFAVFDERETLLMYMELVQGGDLLGYVEKRGRITEDEGKFLFHQLAVGVKYLHDRGVVHRDLKPENLLLSVEDKVLRLKIADFGFANIIGGKSFLKSVVGTPAYVAPEILNKSSTGYTKAADLWSTGVILYACLGGVFPFDEGEPVEQQILMGKFNFPDDYFGDVSDNAIDLVCNLLVVDPKQRYSADDMLRHPWLHVSVQLAL